MKGKILLEMLNRHNKGKIDLSDFEQDRLAMDARRTGFDFKPESKPISKGLFDFADMSTLGMLPNKWRPRSPGQELFGESGVDRFAGGLGSTVGLGVGALGALKASKMGWGALKKMFAKKKADNIATNLYKGNLTPTTPRLNAPNTMPRIGAPPRRIGAPPSKLSLQDVSARRQYLERLLNP